MTARFIKSMGITFIVILMLSIIGCSSATPSKSAEANHKAKTTEVKKEKQDSSAVKDQPTQNQANTAANQATTTTGSSNNQSTSNATGSSASSQTKSVNSSTQSTSSKPTAPSGSSSVDANKTTTSAAQPAAAPAQTPASVTTTQTVTQPPVQSVKLTIIGPKDQSTINKDLKVNIKNGDTVLDVLLNGIGSNNVDYTGSGAFAYVKGIFNVSEFDYGPKSGWTISQNGTRLTRSAGAVQVKDGDDIEWKYTEDYTVNN